MNVQEVSYVYLRSKFSPKRFSLRVWIPVILGFVVIFGGMKMADYWFPREVRTVSVEKGKPNGKNIAIIVGSFLTGIVIIMFSATKYSREIGIKTGCVCPGCNQVIDEVEIKFIITNNKCKKCRYSFEKLS